VNSRAAWLAWSLCAACVALIALALLLIAVTDDVPLGLPGERSGPVLTVLFAVLTGVLSLAYPTVGALIASRLPTNPIGWLFCGVGLLYAVRRFTIAYADYTFMYSSALPGEEYVAWFSTWVAFSGLILAGIFLMLLFPDGRLPSRRWRVVAWAAVFGATLTALAHAFRPGYLDSHPYINNPFGVEGVIGGRFTTYEFFAASVSLGSTLLSLSTLAALFMLIARLRRARGDERQQLKWFLYAAVPATVCLTLILLQAIAYNLTAESLLFNNVGVVSWLASCACEFPNTVNYFLSLAVVASLIVPVFTYIAILRYHLYDIDLIINRTLVYGALSACVVALYVVVVGYLGMVLRTGTNLAISLAATGLIAVLFAPLRDRLQRGVNRLMYGERDEPYKVLSELGASLEATLAPESVLPTVVETVARALKLPYAAIILKQDGVFVEAARYGKKPAGEPLIVPLTYQRETVGQLVVSPRAPGESFTKSDVRLLRDLARHIEVAAYAVRLTADLQRSRERLVTAREEERRRLRRDLHDGVGPQLAALTLELETARNLLSHDPQASALMADLSERARATVSDVRRSVHALRPPALDELGLIPALREGAAQYSQNGLRVSVRAPESLPPLPAAAEVATYHIVQEAMTNVVRHAGARNCSVRIALDEEAGTLSVEIEDDGRGIEEGNKVGVGLHSMRERAEELGGRCTISSQAEGGTLVSAELPCRMVDEDNPKE
jgi:signal transduction histidine kinase